MAGNTLLPVHQIQAVIEQFAHTRGLSRRETEVLLLAAAGLHRKDAASQLACSAGTVHTYWRRIFHKMRCSSQAEVFVAIMTFALHGPHPSPLP
jgi:DNA-binding NarL/FixJ family response regulator